MDWYSLSPLTRLGYCALGLIIIAGNLYIAKIITDAIWKRYMEPKPKQVIKHPERIKVLAYDQKGRPIYQGRRDDLSESGLGHRTRNH
jgi:hypothetical protein